MQSSDHYGRVQCAPIESEQFFEPLIPEFFAANVDCSIDVGIDQPARCRPVQSPPDPLSGKDWGLLRLPIIRDRVEVQAACLRGVALFTLYNLDALFLSLVPDHVDESAVRNAHEVLVVAPAQVDPLLPAAIATDHHFAQPVSQTIIHDQPACLVQKILNLFVALEPLDADVRILFFCSELCHLLVVLLIEALQHSALDQNRGHSWFGRYTGCKVVDAQIYKQGFVGIELNGWFLLFLLDDSIGQLHHETVSHRNDSQIAGDSIFGLCIEDLIFNARNRQRLKTLLLTTGNTQHAVLDLIAVSTDIEGSVAFFISRKPGLAGKLFWMLAVLGHRLGIAFELFGDNLPLALSACRRGHGTVIFLVMFFELLIQFFSSGSRLFVEDTLAQGVGGTVAEPAGLSAQAVACLPVRVIAANYRSLDFLYFMHFSKGAHSVHNLKVHLIFVVAYRRKAINARILEHLQEVFTNVCSSFPASPTMFTFLWAILPLCA